MKSTFQSKSMSLSLSHFAEYSVRSNIILVHFEQKNSFYHTIFDEREIPIVFLFFGVDSFNCSVKDDALSTDLYTSFMSFFV